ncbi:uncharacterized protein BCR38DRAFT_436036 [Pseudomassariella vexata]|uniref:F-box domain-containing protein n=1 Tax=Pseudomassariella vexata TaxID=1141098 RepID=A0A1Y2DV52_9PEZI|nr:uncharacterized protein BCR38DRAFT_436036 [Pseudomassariella vexata]ORY63151.1 hypothetical protein BCR38DRAFT_436036 [Pseudomassariella vexata]
MDALPVELLRLIFSSCDPPSVRTLRETNRTLADVGYDYLLPPKFTILGYRDDIDHLHSIALHDRLRGSIESIVINLAEVDEYYARHSAYCQHFAQLPEERAALLTSAFDDFRKVQRGRKTADPLHTRSDDLREAFTALPNLKDVAITFTQCPLDDSVVVMREVYDMPNCRKMDRPLASTNLDTIIFALHGVRLSSFSVDRFPLEMLKNKVQRKHWFAHAQSFDSLSELSLTLDPSGLVGPSSAVMAVNGLGYLLQVASQLKKLKLAFHPYSSPDSKFALSFRELLNGFTFTKLEELTLEGVSCDEQDLREFLARHNATLRRLRLGGRGLATPDAASSGGIHLYEGNFKSLFAGLHVKLPNLERLHLEGIFECEHRGLPSHETYNFYPLTNESWESVPCPRWVRASRKTINCLPFEQFVRFGGSYPGNALAQNF